MMKKKKNILFFKNILFLLSSLVGLMVIVSSVLSLTADAAFPNPIQGSFLKRVGNALIPTISGDTLGDSSNRWSAGYFTFLDSNTIQIGGAASGDFTVNNGHINLASSTKTYRIGGNEVLSSTTLTLQNANIGPTSFLFSGPGTFSNTLTIGGTSTSTITGNGTPNVIGGVLTVKGGSIFGNGGLILEGAENAGGSVRIDLTNATSATFQVETANGSIFKIDQPNDLNLDINFSIDNGGSFVFQPSGGKLVVGGTATSTITGDGTVSTIGNDLNVAGTISAGANQGLSLNGYNSNTYLTYDAGGNTLDISLETPTSTLTLTSTGWRAILDVSGISTVDRTFTFPDQSGTFGIFSAVPTASTTPCVVGEFAATSTYIYVCVSPNQWTRATSTINW